MDELRTKLIALFAALYFFVLSLPYGNQPVKVELTYEVKTAQTQYTDGDKVAIQAYAKNVGRPYYGHVSSFCMTCSVFQTVNGERQALSIVPQSQPGCGSGNADQTRRRPVGRLRSNFAKRCARLVLV